MRYPRKWYGVVLAAFLLCGAADFAIASGATDRGDRITIPATTPLTVKLDEAISPKTAGQDRNITVTFSEPVQINGVSVIPVGASGAVLLSGMAQHSPQIELNSVFVNGRSYRVTTSPITFNPKVPLPAGKKLTFDLVLSLNLGR